MKKFISYLLLCSIFSLLLSSMTPVFAGGYDDILKEVVSTGENELPEWKQLIEFLEKPDTLSDGIWWWEWIRNTLVSIGVDIILPVMVFTGIVIAIIWFYKLMISESAEETWKSWRYIAFGIIGTMIMVSAWYIASLLVWADGTWWSIFSFSWDIDWWSLATEMYQNLFYPFIKLFLSVVLGILFIIVLINGLKMIFGNTEDEQKKSFNMFIYGIVWVLVISLSKTLVELVYGSYERVTWPVQDNLGSVWLLFDWVWPDGESLKVVWSILNWVLWLAVFIVVLIIIYLGFMMLFRPDNEEAPKKIKTYLIYAVIGIFIIWGSYILSRMFIITWA